MQADTIESILADVPFFDVCTPEQLSLLAFTSEQVQFAPGDILFAEGDPGDGAYAIASGTILMFSGTDEDGGYRACGPGVLVGEMGLMLSQPRRETARARSHVSAVFVPRAAFSRLIRQFPEVAEAASEQIKRDLQTYLDALMKFTGSDRKS